MFDSIDIYDQKAKIKVVGVGGGGCNAVERMIQGDVNGVEFIAINTDAKVLKRSSANSRILIGKKITQGLGAGADPEIGKNAALEDESEIYDQLAGTDMVFITTGLGGGTGSGASPVIAKIARDLKCLTVGVVTKPFSYEGPKRMSIAIDSIEELKKYVDVLIVIPNDRLLQVNGRDTRCLDAYIQADNVLKQAIMGIVDVIETPGVINIDFADIRRIMTKKGSACIGIGSATGPMKAKEAAELAIKSPLLETSIAGATSAIINITSSERLSLYDVAEIVNTVRDAAQTQIDVKCGQMLNTSMDDEVVVTVIVTGFSTDPMVGIKESPFTDDRDNGKFDTPVKPIKIKTKKGKNKSDDGVNIPDWLK